MADRVEKFLAEFEAAIDSASRQRRNTREIASAERVAGQLAELLDRLAGDGVFPSAVPAEDLRALADELAAIQAPVSLAPLIENARALLKVIDDGIVDGDSERLQAALATALEIGEEPSVSRGDGRRRLAVPVLARCGTCDEIIVGRRRGGARNWSAVTQELRNHEREHHGGYTTEVRDELRAALDRVRAGEAEVTAGRYVIVQR